MFSDSFRNLMKGLYLHIFMLYLNLRLSKYNKLLYLLRYLKVSIISSALFSLKISRNTWLKP